MMRVVLVAALILGLGALGLAVAGGLWRQLPVGKLYATASGLAGIAALAQLEVSGWFTRVMELYGDESKFPYGPPSVITRQIIDDPDHPLQGWIRDTVFYD